MKLKKIRLLCVILSLLFAFSCVSVALNNDEITDSVSQWIIKNISVEQAENKIDSYLDWSVFSMARNGNDYFNLKYADYINSAVKNNKSELQLNDYARISLACLSIGLDAKKIGGTNLIEQIENADYSSQSFTGTVAYALIALDSAGSNNIAVKNQIIDILISSQRNDGGFNAYLEADSSAYWTIDGETDSTGIVLQALAPYQSNANVASLIRKAVSFVKSVQLETGGFGYFGFESAESTSMVLAGLCEIGENPDSFIKNGNNIFDALSKYINDDGGAKCYDGTSNLMTSYQVLMGVSAYYRYKNNKVGLFDMSCLSPKCNSIEHYAFFVKHSKIGQIICRFISKIYFVLGKDYYCCKH